MKHLKDYCLDVCVIDGLQTYVISPAKYSVLIKDNELLNYLKRTENDILPYIDVAREIGFIMCITEIHGCAESVSI